GAGAGVSSANGASSGDQRQVEGGDPTGREVVDGGDGVEGPEPGRQAAGGRRVPAAAVGEPEGGLLGDRGRPVDLDPVDVVLGAPRPVGGRVGADAVHVFQLDASLTLVDAVDREVDGGDLTRIDHALGRLDLFLGHPLVPRGGDLV